MNPPAWSSHTDGNLTSARKEPPASRRPPVEPSRPHQHHPFPRRIESGVGAARGRCRLNCRENHRLRVSRRKGNDTHGGNHKAEEEPAEAPRARKRNEAARGVRRLPSRLHVSSARAASALLLRGATAERTARRGRDGGRGAAVLSPGDPPPAASFSASCRSLPVATQPRGPGELMYQAMAEVIY